ncbi:hypothetical protein BDQ94DRAFT_163537 [Aspergillus welwitschiae]|uniref:Uncharacterized protein n=1 Tax=Aspergillus welwitschiae TaxID=1341132 RepID=A0A3F3PL30_9EURO|nr:hypothetical protein BDQ94DRAFT_163537 [Aspergillus welwitschiae]RDH27558.1 hypothetical protein BDQ94DRAFT_163537 [Aspergillus welwitschiae]
MDEILELYTYYRACYPSLFLKDLQDMILHILHRLSTLHRGQCVTDQGVDTAIAIAADLRCALDSLRMRKYKSN